MLKNTTRGVVSHFDLIIIISFYITYKSTSITFLNMNIVCYSWGVLKTILKVPTF